MSIGIAIATADTVLLVADGRHSAGSETLSDTVEKIDVLRDDLAVISTGVVLGTDMLLQWMKHERVPLHADELSTFIRDRVWAAGNTVLQMLPEDVRTSNRIKVGLVGGGIDTDGTYITGSLFGANMDSAATATSRCVGVTLVRIVLGGEEVGAQAYFDQSAHRSVGGVSDPQMIIPAILQAAIQTVRFAANADPTIGGRIQFTILKQGQLPQTGFVD